MTGIVVALRKGESPDAFAERLTADGYSFEQKSGLPRFFVVAEQTPDTFALKDHPAILAVEDCDRVVAQPQEYRHDITLSQDDGMLSGSWGLARIIRRRPPWNPDRVTFPINTHFETVRTGVGVDVYVLDTGVDCTHPCFEGRAFSLLNGDASDDSVGYHGTNVASCVGGISCGPAVNAQIFSVVEAATDTGVFTAQTVIDGYSAMINHYNSRAGLNRPAIANNSYGGEDFESALMTAAINDAIDAGIVVVFASGNNFRDLDGSYYFGPAEAAADMIVVAGCSMNDTEYWYTWHGGNYGVNVVDICAPTSFIRVAKPGWQGGGYRTQQGTSFSAPLVSGVLACMLEGYGRLSGKADVLAVRQKLLDNATTGRLRLSDGVSLPDRIVYLDPKASFEVINGLTPL